ncbi:LAFA_0G00254g1_1 [Lachancea sp. 'fantastica']|nr:LAFA_0G00254g1_1 [Lachancea sp. 'fantastica']
MKSAKPSFKVALSNRTNKVGKLSKKSKLSYRPKEHKHSFEDNNGVNLYMTYVKPEVIPKPPQVLSALTESTSTDLMLDKSLELKSQNLGLSGSKKDAKIRSHTHKTCTKTVLKERD